MFEIINYYKKNLFLVIIISLLFVSLSINGLAADSDVDAEIELNKVYQHDNLDLNLSAKIDEDGASLPELWLQFKRPDYDLIVGKKNLKQGPGYFSQLMLSDEGPSLNVIMSRSEHDLFNVHFKAKQFVAFLGEGVDKQLFVHRLENNTLFPNLKIGISEAMMASEHIHPAYYIPIPYWPYYLTSKLIGLDSKYNSYEDKYIGLDFTYDFDNDVQVYGELMVDEYAQHSSANNPDKRAHLLGMSYPYQKDLMFRAEYSNVFNCVYGHRYAQNNYVYDDELIGHRLGPDSDVFDVEMEKIIDQNQTLKVGLRYIRKGLGNFSIDSEMEHEENKFLSTVTERQKLLRIEYERDVSNNITTGIETEIGQAWIKDKGSEDFVNVDFEVIIEL